MSPRATSLMSRRRDARRAAEAERSFPFKLAEAPTAPATSADVCRTNGWGPGDRITDGVITLTITAVGDGRILARGSNGVEMSFGLGLGPWRKIYECAACGKDCDASVQIHRDGLSRGPLVPICLVCTTRHDEKGDPAATWAAIKARLAAINNV